jgi:hypothetical protein
MRPLSTVKRLVSALAASGMRNAAHAHQLSVVVLMLIPRREQHDINVAHREEHNASSVTEGNDQLPKLPVFLGSTTGVWRKREDSQRTFHGVAETKKASVIRRMARQLARNDVFLEALNILLEREACDNAIPTAHPPARLALAVTAARMRC